MPKSRIRRRFAFKPPPEKKAPGSGTSPPWLAPVMIAFFVIGLLWVVTFYVTQREYPIESLGNWNMGIGFGFIAVGFVLSTRWK